MVRKSNDKKPSPIAKATIPDDDQPATDRVAATDTIEREETRRAPPTRIERPKLPKTSATKCIYFRDAQQLADLDSLAKVYPTGSVSGLIQQLVAALLEANAKTGNPDRKIKLNAEIYL